MLHRDSTNCVFLSVDCVCALLCSHYEFYLLQFLIFLLLLFLFLLHKEFYVSEMPDWSTNGLTILVPRRRNAPKKYQLIRSYVSRWVIWAELSLFYSAVWHSQLQFSWERKSSDCAIANIKGSKKIRSCFERITF